MTSSLQYPGNVSFFIHAVIDNERISGVIECNKETRICVLTTANLYAALWNKSSKEVLRWVKEHQGTATKYTADEAI